MKTVVFKEDTHQYFLPGDQGWEFELVSVSKILQGAKIYNYGRTEANIAGMSRGSHVHKLTQLIDNETLVPEDLAEEKEYGYVKAYEAFKKDYNFKVLISEKPMHNPKYMYAGTADRFGIATIGGVDVRCLVDLKTGKPHPGNSLQIAAYWEMLVENGEKVDASLCVYLSKDGKYKVIPEADHDMDFKVFVCALNLWRWKARNNIKDEIWEVEMP